MVAHYNEEISILADTIEQVKKRLSGRTRIIIYSKGDRDEAGLQELLAHADEVVPLKNIGREGETYLVGFFVYHWGVRAKIQRHIARHYDLGATSLADYTLFLQPHLAWHWILLPRIESIRHDTGFLSFGPYKAKTCTHDSQNLGFPRMADVYSSFQGTLCPPGTHLVSRPVSHGGHPLTIQSTWAGQFVVSRKRILDNPLRNYQNLIDLFNAPEHHWMWKEGWGNNQPSNPTLGRSSSVHIQARANACRSCARALVAGDIQLHGRTEGGRQNM